jgi:hypothetical protein
MCRIVSPWASERGYLKEGKVGPKHMLSKRAWSLIGVLLLLVSCAGQTRSQRTSRETEKSAEAPNEPAEQPAEELVRVGPDGTYLRPNIELPDGSPGYVHVTPGDMPWVVAIGYPRRPPKYGSRKKARQVAIEAMEMWEEMIQPHVPWFQLEFVEEDSNAPVQVIWKRRITGSWAGFGRFGWRIVDGKLRVGGEMQVSTTPDNFTILTIDELALLIAHEFGHVLGLGHCLDCDSAMNYAWNTRERIIVTDLDVRTFAALVARRNSMQPTPRSGDLVASQPCRYMGTFHQVRRARLEQLRMAHEITHDEWACMARALASVDEKFTAECADRSIPFEEMLGALRDGYSTCVDASRLERAVSAP